MKASDWISVKDRLPELYRDVGSIKFSREVLLCLSNDEVLTASLVCDKSDNTKFWSSSRSGSYALKEGTHWQPIVLPKKRKVMNKVNNWQKLTTLPKGVVKEQGRFTGEYNIRISYVDGVWFIEYVYSGLFYGDIEPTYPDTFSGDTLGEAVNKASNFFESNFGKYKLIS